MAALINLFLETHIGKFLAFLFTSGLVVWFLRAYHQYHAAKRAIHNEESARLLNDSVNKLIEQNSELVNEKIEQRVREELDKKGFEKEENDVGDFVTKPEAVERDSSNNANQLSNNDSTKLILLFAFVGVAIYYFFGRQVFIPVSSETDFKVYVDNVVLENSITSEKLYIGRDGEFISFRMNDDIYGSWYWSNEDKLCFSFSNWRIETRCVKVFITPTKIKFFDSNIEMNETTIWKFPKGYETGL